MAKHLINIDQLNITI